MEFTINPMTGRPDITSRVKNNLSALSVPTATDDSTKGYGSGSRWLVPSQKAEYICTHALPGEAVWVLTTPANPADNPFPSAVTMARIHMGA